MFTIGNDNGKIKKVIIREYKNKKGDTKDMYTKIETVDTVHTYNFKNNVIKR